MSSRITYTADDGTNFIGIRDTCTSDRTIEVAEGAQVPIAYRLPTDPAELHRLVEAILGRKVAAVIYEDELPEVTEAVGGGYRCGQSSADAGVSAEHEWRWARERVALARHIEAHDAANAKEQERAEDAAIDALAHVLCQEPNWTATARRAYELGARAPQGEEAGR